MRKSGLDSLNTEIAQAYGAHCQPEWDLVLVEELIGKTVLIGLTSPGDDGPNQQQMFGTVISADRVAGFTVALEGTRLGGTYLLAPHPQAFLPARPGDYRLRTTGEIVSDPDFTTTWTIERPLS